MNQQEAIKQLAIYHNVNESSVYIPQYLLDRDIWVLWRLEEMDGRKKPQKIPYNPRTRYKKAFIPNGGKTSGHYARASTTAPATWGTFDQAIKALTAKENAADQFSGIGIVLSPSDDLVFIDLDHCLDELNEPDENAQKIITAFNDQFIEYSQSGSGLHIFTLGKIPENLKKGVEMYTESRFCACTFKTYEGHSYEPGAKQAEIAELYRRYKSQAETGETAEEKPETSSTARRIDPEDSLTHKLTTKELIALIEQSKHGEMFKALYHDGNMDGYKSPSDADMALCGLLAFWTDGDVEWMDSIFRASALMRKKWDERRGKSTYGRDTITKAIKNCNEFYTEGISRIRSENAAAAFSTAPEPEEMPKLSRCPDRDALGGDNEFMDELDAVLEYINPTEFCKQPDDINFARLFAATFRTIARYNTTINGWMLFNGTVWQPDEGGTGVNLLSQYFQRGLLKTIGFSTDERYMKAVSRLADQRRRDSILKTATAHLSISADSLDNHPEVFNCVNGEYNLESHTFREGHDSSLLLTKISNVCYDPEARADTWMKYLSDIIILNQDYLDSLSIRTGENITADSPKAKEEEDRKRKYLQMVLGLALTEDTSNDCFFVFYGPQTRNGKSTMSNVLKHMLKDYFRSIDPDTLAKGQTRRTNGEMSEDLLNIRGARLVIASEPKEGISLDEAQIKKITGRNTLKAALKYQHVQSFTAVCKVIYDTNTLPSVTDMTLFDSRRVKVLTFNKHLSAEDIDATLEKRLTSAESISGLFNWCIEGLKNYHALGTGKLYLAEPDCVKAETREYQGDSDTIGQFIEDCLEPNPGGYEKFKDVYKEYHSWQNRLGEWLHIEREKKFREKLKSRGLIGRYTKNGQDIKNAVIGYRIKPDNDFN